MPLTRREILAALAAACAVRLRAAEVDRPAIAESALALAKKAGADYADVRINRYDYEDYRARERQIQSVSSQTSFGYGIRVLKKGAWGFAASNDFSPKTLAATVATAVEIAEANAAIMQRPVKLAPLKAYEAKWDSGYKTDPFDIGIDDKVGLLTAMNDAALGVAGVSFISSYLSSVREDKFFASSIGSVIAQDLVRVDGGFNITAVDRAAGESQSRASLFAPTQQGWEALTGHGFEAEAKRGAEEAVAKLNAKPVEPGLYDLILEPTHLWLTIHESCGHATELDRALGYEANYAGTSFLTADKLGEFQYGSKLVNMVADRTEQGSLSTVAYDDDGVPAQRWNLIKDGVFVEYQSTREQVAWLGGVKSRGCAHADSWDSVVFQRMPNVSLDPGDSNLTTADLIGGVEKGVLIQGDGSYSIDQQRYNFQFGGQVFHEIKDGKIVGLLRDVAYQARTPEFWNSCDGIASRAEYAVGGTFRDGKGEPSQINAVSHGCSPSRFRQVNVLNTGRRS